MENSEKKELIISSLSDPIREILIDIAEMNLDDIVEKISKNKDLLKDIPIIKWLVLGNDVRTIIQGAFFLQKYSNFIGPINEAMKDDLTNDDRLTKIFSDKKVFSKIIDQTIISLDRYQTTQKARILGVLYVETFKNKNFTIDEYNTLIFSIDLIHPTMGFNCLKSFYDYYNEWDKEENTEKKDKIWMANSSRDYSPLVNTSLLRLPDGGMYAGNYGGAFINELGYKFYELVVSKI